MNEDDQRQERRYWKSLERLIDSPALQDFPGEEFPGEFPVGASDPPDAVSRRDMLKVMAASFALAGVASCRRPEETIVPYVDAPEGIVPGIPRYFATCMPLGTSAYGVVVESHEGRPTKIEGNELHPSSLGSAGSWMQASILGLYDPDRSRRVRRRTAAGTDAEDSSWEEFVTAWTEISAGLQTTGGNGLAVLSEAFSSPTQARLARELRRRFPQSRWFTFEPAGDDAIFEGLRLATGTAARPVYHLEEAQTIVAVDCDFLLTESEAVSQARAFASGRRPREGRASMNRLYAIESALSLTGSNADHRLQVQSRQIPAVLARLAVALGVPADLGAESADLSEDVTIGIQLIAQDLLASGGAAVIMAGCRQPPQVHALAYTINAALGAVGRTVRLNPLQDAVWGSASQLRSLLEHIRQGDVSTLVILGSNPVFSAPGDLPVAETLERMERVIQLSSHEDETTPFCHWHLPQAHYLEAWGDTRSAAGSAGVIQPLIAPLLEGRSAIECLSIFGRDTAVSGYELVRETWLGTAAGIEERESQWRRILHDGVAPPEWAPEPSLLDDFHTGLPDAEARPADSNGFEIVFLISPSVGDGRFANNAWLQEFPDPLTGLVWDNPALISPRTAAELDVSTGDVVALEVAGRALEAPVLVLPGQADGSIALELGYGRTAGGRVCEGVGVNGSRLRTSASRLYEGGLVVRKTGSTAQLARTQEHWQMEGRSLVREATLEVFQQNPGFAQEPEAGLKSRPLFPYREYNQGHQWGMAVDLNACIGCGACVTACQSENNVPVVGKTQVAKGREMLWLRVDRYFSGDIGDPQLVFQPVPCMQCENAPCEQVCPVAATVHDREGLNAMVYNRCIGTRYCSNNCPYKVRRFNYFNYTKDLPELVQMAMNPDVTVRSRGVMEKCTYCVQRINETRIRSKLENRAIRDGEIRTACQQTCPAEAIVFGDINDPESRVSRLKQDQRNYVLLAELDNRPRTSYLARLRNPNPQWVTQKGSPA